MDSLYSIIMLSYRLGLVHVGASKQPLHSHAGEVTQNIPLSLVT